MLSDLLEFIRLYVHLFYNSTANVQTWMTVLLYIYLLLYKDTDIYQQKFLWDDGKADIKHSFLWIIIKSVLKISILNQVWLRIIFVNLSN